MPVALILLLLLGACASTPEPTGNLAEPSPAPAVVPLAVLEIERESATHTSSSTLARSVEGSPIELRTFGDGPARVLLIGLIHGSEPEGYEQFESLWDTIATDETARRATLHAIPSMNPDGHGRGSRYNVNGIDLNRNWPASNFSPSRRRGDRPLSEPETAAVHAHLESFAPDLLIVFHSISSGPFVDPDGPALGAGAAFVAAAAEVDPRWRLLPDFTNPAGSLGSYAGLDRGIPTLTIEFDRGQDAALAREAAAAGVLAAIASLGR
ncbi:MAG: M14 family zinc carboxypeptidase [Planctomycetota bacterium]